MKNLYFLLIFAVFLGCSSNDNPVTTNTTSETYKEFYSYPSEKVYTLGMLGGKIGNFAHQNIKVEFDYKCDSLFKFSVFYMGALQIYFITPDIATANTYTHFEQTATATGIANDSLFFSFIQNNKPVTAKNIKLSYK